MLTSLQHRSRTSRERARKHALADGEPYTVGILDYKLHNPCPYVDGGEAAKAWALGYEFAKEEARIFWAAQQIEQEQR